VDHVGEYTKDDALTFVEAMRLMLNNKVGFKRTTEKLSDLATYIESVAAENDRLNAYLDSAGRRADYEAYVSGSHSAAEGLAEEGR
jgi:hypothetical protein